MNKRRRENYLSLIFVAAALLLMGQFVRADAIDEALEGRLLAGAYSYHIEHDWGGGAGFNSNHKLIGVEVEGWYAAYFENSYYLDSFAAGYTWRGNLFRHVDWHAGLGVTYGYPECFIGAKPDVPLNEQSSKNVCPDAEVGLTYTRYAFEPSLSMKGTAVYASGGIPFSFRLMR